MRFLTVENALEVRQDELQRHATVLLLSSNHSLPLLLKLSPQNLTRPFAELPSGRNVVLAIARMADTRDGIRTGHRSHQGQRVVRLKHTLVPV